MQSKCCNTPGKKKKKRMSLHQRNLISTTMDSKKNKHSVSVQWQHQLLTKASWKRCIHKDFRSRQASQGRHKHWYLPPQRNNREIKREILVNKGGWGYNRQIYPTHLSYTSIQVRHKRGKQASDKKRCPWQSFRNSSRVFVLLLLPLNL